MRVGFTCSKKVGNAVERNRVRRRLREVVRLSPPEAMRRGFDYVLIGRTAALQMPYDRLVEDFDRALRRVHASRPDGKSQAVKGQAGNAGGSPNTTPHRGAK